MPVFALIMKILACAVGLYVAAAFVVSLRRLLPFLTLGASVATIVSIARLTNHPDARSLIWAPIVLSLATLLFYRGEGYMSPNIVENAYRVVSIERKWTSVFADDDDYEVHFAPVEIGGFFENTFFAGLLFWFFYSVFLLEGGNSAIAYIPAIYFLGMSVVEILLVVLQKVGVLSDFPTLLYWIARGVVIVVALVIGFTNPFANGLFDGSKTDRKSKKLYEQCVELVKLDYTVSYRVTTQSRMLGGTEYTPTNFLYDADRDAAAFYRLTEEGERAFQTVFAVDPRLAVHAKFQKSGATYHFASFASKNTSHPLLFAADTYPTYDTYNIPSLCEFTLHKVANATQIKQHDENEPMQILYATRNDTTTEHPVDYQVAFYFNTDKKGKPTSFHGIICEIYSGDLVYQFCYYPVQGDTGIHTLFNYDDGTLKNYVPGGEMEAFYNEVEQAIWRDLPNVNPASGQHDLALTAHILTWIGSETVRKTQYYYDAQNGVTAKYESNQQNGSSAAAYNAFSDYPPEQYILNGTVYNHNKVPIQTGPTYPFTGTDLIASQAILNLLNTTLSFDRERVTADSQGNITAALRPQDFTIADTYTCSEIFFTLRWQGDQLTVTKLSATFNAYATDETSKRRNCRFFAEVFLQNQFDIPDPTK